MNCGTLKGPAIVTVIYRTSALEHVVELRVKPFKVDCVLVTPGVLMLTGFMQGMIKAIGGIEHPVFSMTGDPATYPGLDVLEKIAGGRLPRPTWPIVDGPFDESAYLPRTDFVDEGPMLIIPQGFLD